MSLMIVEEASVHISLRGSLSIKRSSNLLKSSLSMVVEFPPVSLLSRTSTYHFGDMLHQCVYTVVSTVPWGVISTISTNTDCFIASQNVEHSPLDLAPHISNNRNCTVPLKTQKGLLMMFCLWCSDSKLCKTMQPLQLLPDRIMAISIIESFKKSLRSDLLSEFLMTRTCYSVPRNISTQYPHGNQCI